jgi:hypothetical protein
MRAAYVYYICECNDLFWCSCFTTHFSLNRFATYLLGHSLFNSSLPPAIKLLHNFLMFHMEHKHELTWQADRDGRD